MSETADLAQSLREFFGRAQRVLREQGGRLGLTASQTEALGYVHRDGPLTITALANRQRVRSQSMGATVEGLLKEGLVTVSRSPDDGRKKVVAATAKAGEVIEERRHARTDWLTLQLESLSPSELKCLAKAYQLLDRIFP